MTLHRDYYSLDTKSVIFRRNPESGYHCTTAYSSNMTLRNDSSYHNLSLYSLLWEGGCHRSMLDVPVRDSFSFRRLEAVSWHAGYTCKDSPDGGRSHRGGDKTSRHRPAPRPRYFPTPRRRRRARGSSTSIASSTSSSTPTRELTSLTSSRVTWGDATLLTLLTASS